MSDWKDKKLRRSSRNNKIAGVCGGIAEYLGIDPTVIRVLFAVSVLFGGAGIWIYIILAIVMPKAGPDDEDF